MDGVLSDGNTKNTHASVTINTKHFDFGINAVGSFFRQASMGCGTCSPSRRTVVICHVPLPFPCFLLLTAPRGY